MFLAQVNRLSMLAAPQIPNMHLVAVSAGKKSFRIESVLDFVRSRPFTGDQCVMSEVPPEVVGQFLGSAIDFPASQNVKIEVIENENPTRTAAVRRAKGADVNAFRTAMDSVRT